MPTADSLAGRIALVVGGASGLGRGAAEALGCRLVYALVPIKPLTQTIEERASRIAEAQIAAVEQTMKLEAQAVSNKKQRKQAHRRRVEELLQRPARLWDE